jgi:hypothetical protein
MLREKHASIRPLPLSSTRREAVITEIIVGVWALARDATIREETLYWPEGIPVHQRPICETGGERPHKMKSPQTPFLTT